jgi:hypothetical protein
VDILNWIQNWHKNQCGGYWERMYGINIFGSSGIMVENHPGCQNHGTSTIIPEAPNIYLISTLFLIMHIQIPILLALNR